MLFWLYMVKIPSQAVLALLRYRYLRKPRNNLYLSTRESMRLIMRDFDKIRISLLMVLLETIYEDQEQLQSQNKTLQFSLMFILIIIIK